MSWHSPWITLSILAGLIVYVILAIFLTKRATVEIPLSDNERGKRRSWIMFSWLLALGSLAGLVACVYVLLDARNPSPFAAIGCLAAIIGFIVALGLGQNTARILRPTRITDSHVWLRGVHSSILEQLPPLA